MAFDRDHFYGLLVKGQVDAAMAYLRPFPDQSELYQRYVARFEAGEPTAYDVDEHLNAILAIYQAYFRDVFYRHASAEDALEAMRKKCVALFSLPDADTPFDAIEATRIAEAFSSRALHFLGGRTGGYYGPYIWRTSERKQYRVELPGGVQDYAVVLLDNFLFKGWYDYVSFGAIGTGGWTGDDGIIHCDKSAYRLEDESFTVSLLKHEAQHAMDLAEYPGMSSADLEYRAKLVELIYSCQRNLLVPFAHEADSSRESNGHSLAAHRIMEGFAAKAGSLRPPESYAIEETQAIARELFAGSNAEMRAKYR